MSDLGTRAPKALFDGPGIFWLTWTIGWTLLLVSGMVFLYRRRSLPTLRIRGLPLSFAAVIFLHCYWGAVNTGYVYGPMSVPGVEYWIMSIWLPFGIALFHASNSRFLHVAQAQKKFVRSDNVEKTAAKEDSGRRTLLSRFRSMAYTRKMLTLVSAGMMFQVKPCRPGHIPVDC